VVHDRKKEGGMAVRKETIRTQFTEALGPVLEPGEQVVAGAVTQSGHSPWLTSAFGALGYLIFMAFGTRLYFMAVTDRRVVLIKASILRGRPAGIRFIDARSDVQLTRVKVAAIWSRARYRRSDGKQLRLNFHRKWRDELQLIVKELATP